MEYRTKWIISGNHIEIYKNNTGIRIGEKLKKKKKKRKIEKTEKSAEEIKKLREFAVYRCRRNIKLLINSNPDMTKFLTLTFAENLTNLKECNEMFKSFTRKLKELKPNLKYLVVPEFQKRGAAHYHVLLNINFIESKKLEKLWGYGFIKINNLNKDSNIGLYVSKYIGKDLEDSRYFNNKKYFRSRNLEKPSFYYSKEKNINFLGLNKIRPEYTKIYNSYHGLITYKLYKIDKDEK